MGQRTLLPNLIRHARGRPSLFLALLQLEPRERAEAHITLAQAVDVLQRMQWRACGVDEDTREWKETVR